MIQFYQSLIYPLSSGAISKTDLPDGYFDDVDFLLFKNNQLLGFREFIVLMLNFNRYFYASGISYHDLTESAMANFEGEVRDNLLLSIFTTLAERGTQENKSLIIDLYAYLVSAFEGNAARLNHIEQIKKTFDILLSPFPNSVLEQKMKDKDGKLVLLSDIFSGNEVVYVDFWASWCAPCLKEMPFENQLMTELKDRPIKFVLISLDKNETAWKNAMAKIHVQGDHYIITEGFQSIITSYISFNEIPRYLIFDRNGRLMSRDAPRPSIIIGNKSVLTGLLD